MVEGAAVTEANEAFVAVGPADVAVDSAAVVGPVVDIAEAAAAPFATEAPVAAPTVLAAATVDSCSFPNDAWFASTSALGLEMCAPEERGVGAA